MRFIVLFFCVFCSQSHALSCAITPREKQYQINDQYDHYISTDVKKTDSDFDVLVSVPEAINEMKPHQVTLVPFQLLDSLSDPNEDFTQINELHARLREPEQYTENGQLFSLFRSKKLSPGLYYISVNYSKNVLRSCPIRITKWLLLE